MLADVSAKLLGQFVASLEADVLSGDGSAGESDAATDAGDGDAEPPAAEAATAPVAASAASAPNDGVRVINSPEAEPVDLMDAAGGAVAKRLVPVLAGVTLLAILIWLFRRKKSYAFRASTSGQAARVIILVTLVLFVVVFVVVTLRRRATTRWRPDPSRHVGEPGVPWCTKAWVQKDPPRRSMREQAIGSRVSSVSMRSRVP